MAPYLILSLKRQWLLQLDEGRMATADTQSMFIAAIPVGASVSIIDNGYFYDFEC